MSTEKSPIISTVCGLRNELHKNWYASVGRGHLFGDLQSYGWYNTF